MYKTLLFTKDASASFGSMFAEPPAVLIRPGHEKLAEVDTPLHPQLQEYIGSITPQEGSTWVLVNALGAGEWYGDNINGDYFPYKQLVTHTDDWLNLPVHDEDSRRRAAAQLQYGYPTFYLAHAFRHHVNKDPSRSFGDVMCAVWNERMKRVELVIRLDHERCRLHGAMDIVHRILDGDFPDVSMGCSYLPSAKIMMSDLAEIPISEIVEGSEVLTHKYNRSRVTRVFEQPHEGPVYDVHVYGWKDPLPLTGEHPLWLLRKEQIACHPSGSLNNGKGRKQKVCAAELKKHKKGCAGCSTEPEYVFEWIRADEAAVGDYLATPVCKLQQPTSTRYSDERIELAGHYLAEGYLQYKKKHPCIIFCLGLHEKYKAEHLVRLIMEEGGDWISIREHEDRNGLTVEARSEPLYDFFREHIGHGAKDKRLSTSMTELPLNQLGILLGAYADGDGGEYKGAVYFSTASPQLAKQVQMCAMRLGMVASLNVNYHRALPSSVVNIDTVEYQVWVGSNTAWKLDPYTRRLDLSAGTKKINSKRFFVDFEGVRYLVSPIISIDEDWYKGTVYNFSVKDDESYIMEGLAVHNCRVPYDVCSCCGNHAKTKEEYCRCIRERRFNRDPLGTGQRPYMINIRPRFFDLSFVFIGADKTARTLMKIAGAQEEYLLRHILQDIQPIIPGGYQDMLKVAEVLFYDGYRPYERGDDITLGMVKAASTAGVSLSKEESIEVNTSSPQLSKEAGLRAWMRKLAALQKQNKHLKLSDIIKYVVPHPRAKEVSKIEGGEPDLPETLQNEMGDKGLEESINSSARQGVVLKPHEFLRIALRSSGLGELADKLKGVSPAPTDDVELPCSPELGEGSPELEDKLKSLVSERGISPPTLRRRIVRITIIGVPKEEDSQELGKNPLLNKVGAAYNGYRLWLLANSPELGHDWSTNTADLVSTMATGELDKVSSVEDVGHTLSYLWNAYWQAGELRA